MFWFLYNVLFGIGFLLLLPHFLMRMWRRGGYRRHFQQRFGVYAPEVRECLRAHPRFWIHAVSVGEIYVALRFVEEFRRKQSDAAFVISTTTSTGYALAAEKISGTDVLIYYPVDFPLFVRRALNAIRPKALILTEGELWPNMLRQAAKRDIPVFVVNGRVSEGSYRGYLKIRKFFKRAVASVNLLLMQGQGDAQRMRNLGVEESRLRVMGTAKYDVACTDAAGEEAARSILMAAGIDPGASILVGGSTWPGEEAELLKAYRELRPQCPGLRLVLVPRHAERRDEVEQVIREAGFGCIKRSTLENEQSSPDSGDDVLMVDSTGELRYFYACATVIFVGKSLGDNHGGQNIIEPALQAKPIVVGPNMENFPVVMEDFLAADAVVQIRSAGELTAVCGRLLESAEKGRSYGRRARALLESKLGVVGRSVDAILERLPTN